MIREFREPKIEKETKEEEIPKIEVPKSKAERFRMEEAFYEAFERLQTIPWSEYIELMEKTTEIKDPDELSKYLKENEPRLSEEAKFFLKVIIEKRRIEKEPIPPKEETVILSGKEAEEFKKYRAYYEKIEKDIKEIEKEDIKAIEKLPLNLEDKRDLILLYLGEKPASLIEESKSYKKEKEIDFLEKINQEREKIEQIFKNLGLFWKRGGIYKVVKKKSCDIGYKFLVSKNPENLSQLIKALEEKDSKKIGLSLGYPKTAAEAFAKGELLDYKNLKKLISKEEWEEIKKENLFKFLTFHLSKDHWREELEIVKRHQKLIKEKAPRLYEEIIKEGIDPLKSKLGFKGKFYKILNILEYYKRGFSNK
jgi:hypothetical protein